MGEVKLIKPNDKDWLNYVPKPDVMIDIGVGVRNSEAWLLKKKWDDVFVVGLEPNERRFGKCRNGFPGKIIHAAAWNEDSWLELQNIDGMSVAFPRDYQKGPSKITVPTRSLDSLEAEFGPWNNILVWSDTEGSELKVLEGSRKLLESGKISCLCLEVWNIFQAPGWCTYDELIEFLEPYGFEPRYRTEQKRDPWAVADVIFLPKEESNE